MPTTTNFGWTTPADTDLVKDGAAAIRTLGNGIDTSLLDLKGGTTGQVLSKNSNTDLDFTWVAQDDSNAIQNAIVDAKGDLISATAADTPARLAVGSNGQVLTADSSTSTGLKWSTPGGGMVYITGATPSSASSQSIDNCFTSSYDNYLITLTPTAASTNSYFYFRLRASGSDTTSNYNGHRIYWSTGTPAADSNSNGTDRFAIGGYATGEIERNVNFLYVFRPQKATATNMFCDYYVHDGGGSYGMLNKGVQTGNTQFDGFTIAVGSGNFSGQIRVYALANS